MNRRIRRKRLRRALEALRAMIAKNGAVGRAAAAEMGLDEAREELRRRGDVRLSQTGARRQPPGFQP